MTSRIPTARASWLGFAVLGSIEFLTVMDASVVNIALPVIRSDLGFTTAGAAWIVNCYLIPFAGLLLLAGRLTDLFGRRRLFLTGTGLFTLASAVCGLATEPWQLLAARVAQGGGAALVFPAALALITDLFDEGRARNRAFAVFGGMGGIAAPVGLIIGGLAADIDWHWIFWINIPLGTAVLVVALAVLPAPRGTATRVDAVGALAATIGLALLAFAAASLPSAHAPTLILAGTGAVVALLVLIHRQRTATDPLIPRALLRHRSLTVGSGIFVLVGTILLATFYLVTLYLQDIRGLAPLAATAAYLPVPLAMLAGTQAAPRLFAKASVRGVLGLGLGLQAASLAAWAMTSSVTGSLLTGMIAPATIWAFGLGIAIVSCFVTCTSNVPGDHAGTASGLATTAYQGGGAVGLAAVAALAATASATHGRPPEPAALLTGHEKAMWALAAGAALAAVLTRALPNARP